MTPSAEINVFGNVFCVKSNQGKRCKDVVPRLNPLNSPLGAGQNLNKSFIILVNHLKHSPS